MDTDSQTLVLIGSIGLASWMLAGFISIVGYTHAYKSWRSLSTRFATGLVILGATLETVMLIGIAFAP